jgi:hypothetical protein
MRRFLLKRCRYDNKEEGCIAFGAGPSVPPMAKINLDIGHALSREDQRQNRRNPCFISQSSSSYSFYGNRAAKFSKKLNRDLKLSRLRPRSPLPFAA